MTVSVPTPEIIPERVWVAAVLVGAKVKLPFNVIACVFKRGCGHGEPALRH